MVCLAATTWAWFTASVTSEANTIQTANFDVNVAVTVGTNTVNAETDGSYNLPADTYTVTVTPDSGASEGFVIITVTELPESPPAVSYIYHTQQIPSGKMLNFTLNLSNISQNATTFKVDFTPHWGKADDYTSIEDIGSTLSGALSDKPALMMLMDDSDELVDAENSDEEDPTDEDAENPEKGEGESDENVDQGENPDDGNGNDEQQPDGSPETPDDGEQGGEQQTSEPSETPDDEGGQQGSETPNASEETGDENGEGGNTEEDPSSEEPTEQDA